MSVWINIFTAFYSLIFWVPCVKPVYGGVIYPFHKCMHCLLAAGFMQGINISIHCWVYVQILKIISIRLDLFQSLDLFLVNVKFLWNFWRAESGLYKRYEIIPLTVLSCLFRTVWRPPCWSKLAEMSDSF